MRMSQITEAAPQFRGTPKPKPSFSFCRTLPRCQAQISPMELQTQNPRSHRESLPQHCLRDAPLQARRIWVEAAAKVELPGQKLPVHTPRTMASSKILTKGYQYLLLVFGRVLRSKCLASQFRGFQEFRLPTPAMETGKPMKALCVNLGLNELQPFFGRVKGTNVLLPTPDKRSSLRASKMQNQAF